MMKEKVKIKCASCGEEIGELHKSPEKKYMGCGSCGVRTLVTINKDGSVITDLHGMMEFSISPKLSGFELIYEIDIEQ